MRHLIVDTETTGLSFIGGDRVIEVAAVEYVDGNPTGKAFYSLIDPERSIPADATAIHGITDDRVKGKPKFHEIARDLLDFCRGAKIIAHNANFDIGMLDNELELAAMDERMNDVVEEVIDSLRIARAIHPKGKVNLDALMVQYEVDASSREAGHNARVDCDLLGKVYFKMVEGVDLSLMNMTKIAPRTSISPVERPQSLPMVEVSVAEQAAQVAMLDEMEASGSVPVARRARMR